MKKVPPDFIVTFTEDKNGFYVNGRKFVPDANPMTNVRVGTYQHWRIVNNTGELHPFQTHQAHSLAYAENGVTLAHPAWLDTVNVPSRGNGDVILDFTDPIIKGHVGISLPSAKSRGQGNDGQDPIQVVVKRYVATRSIDTCWARLQWNIAMGDSVRNRRF
jgi:hypothetical protein